MQDKPTIGDFASSQLPRDGAFLPLAMDRYEVGDELERSESWVVFRVWDRLLQRELAIRTVPESLRENAELLQAFCQEGQTLCQWQHPGLLPIYDLGTLPDGRPSWVTKFIAGQTLAQLLQQESTGRRDVSPYLPIFERVCQTLAYVHRSGWLHLDLKLTNIMVADLGEVYILNWANAQSADASTDDTALGTRSDVFALGAILGEILTGQAPELTNTQGYQRKLEHCGADPELVYLAISCLNPNPNDRPADAGVVASQLASHQAMVRQHLEDARTDHSDSLFQLAEERSRRRSESGLFLILIAILVMGGVTVWSFQRHRIAHKLDLAVSQVQLESEIQQTLNQVQALKDRGLWKQAVLVLKEALEKVESPRHQPLREQVEKKLEEITLLARLEQIRDDKKHQLLSTGETILATKRYREVFESAGWEQGPDSDSANQQWLEQSPIQQELIEFLDDWADDEPEANRVNLIERVTSQVTGKPWRASFQSIAGNQKSLRKLAGELSNSTDTTATDYLLVGRHYVQLGQERNGFLTEGITRFPRNFSLASLLAENSRDDPLRAIRAYQAALAIRPESSNAWVGLGSANLQLKRYAQARMCFEQASKFNPESAQATAGLAQVHLEMGQFAEAKKSFIKVFDLLDPHDRERTMVDQWIEDCNRYTSLQSRWKEWSGKPEILTDEAELIIAARMALQFERKPMVAIACFEQFERQFPKQFDDRGGLRYEAVCSSIAASEVKKVDEIDVPLKTRQRWRSQALTWLRTELKKYQEPIPPKMQKMALFQLAELRRWQRDDALAPVRSFQHLLRMDRASADDWQKFWSDVEDLIQRLEQSTP